ncbi:MAG: hypothetical protein RBU30_02715 [Polyangia bacterium]|mgnify:CR=1 FL=1|jgi:hypothetical protein|nr:hypothetical protein [Polyangia bacterium]
MRTQLLSALIILSSLAGCSSDPLKYRVEEKHINSLPVDKLQEARGIKEKVDAAKQKWEVAKLKQKLVEADFEAAKRFAEAAEYQLQSVKEKVALENKGVPMGISAGALEEATNDLDLAKKNLKYRKLLSELFEKRVEHFFMDYHSLRAQYFESVAMTMVAAGHEQAKDIKKSDYVRQSAERKTMVAETLEAVEKSEASIKELGAELKDAWVPRLSCKPDASKCPECKCPECKCPACQCPKCPENKTPAAPAKGSGDAAGAPPPRDRPTP